MIGFKQALRKVLDRARPLGAEILPVKAALGRTLAETVRARRPIPEFDRSAMDGYAVRSRETVSASPDSPALLRLRGGMKAGCAPAVLAPGTARKIHTGAMIPLGADAVVMKEGVREVGGRLRVERPLRPGENIRRRGEEFAQGDTVLSPGMAITPPVVGLLAVLGRVRVKVRRLPRVSLVVTGNELRPAGAPLKPGQIYDSNSPALTAALRSLDLEPVFTARVGDRREAAAAAMARGLREADVLVTAGGVSVGDYDLVKDVFASLDVRTRFWKVAMKPGKPLFFGTLGRKLVFGLPGNPVPALLAFHCFVRPALGRLMGRGADPLPLHPARFQGTLKRKPGRMELLRGRLSRDASGGLWAVPMRGQESHMLGGLAGADCLIHVPAQAAEIRDGAAVSVSLLHWREL